MVCFVLLGIFLACLSSCIQICLLIFLWGFLGFDFFFFFHFCSKLLFSVLYLISVIFAEILQHRKFGTLIFCKSCEIFNHVPVHQLSMLCSHGGSHPCIRFYAS